MVGSNKKFPRGVGTNKYKEQPPTPEQLRKHTESLDSAEQKRKAVASANLSFDDTDFDDEEDSLDEKPTIDDIVGFLDSEGQLGKPAGYRRSVKKSETVRRLDWDKFLGEDTSE